MDSYPTPALALVDAMRAAAAAEPARAVVNAFHRQALHAHLLAFEHPRTGDVMEFEAPMPADMQDLVDALRR